MLHRDDLLDATLAWVIGEIVQVTIRPNGVYYSQFNTDGRLDVDKFHEFCLNVHNIVWRHLHGRQTLDTTCSDMCCSLAIRAKHVFGPHLSN